MFKISEEAHGKPKTNPTRLKNACDSQQEKAEYWHTLYAYINIL